MANIGNLEIKVKPVVDKDTVELCMKLIECSDNRRKNISDLLNFLQENEVCTGKCEECKAHVQVKGKNYSSTCAFDLVYMTIEGE